MSALPEMTRRPRMIATDLDGTIIGYEHTRTGWVSPRTVAAFDAARQAGIEVVFVTGRPMRWLTPLAEHLSHAGPVICSNGAAVVELETMQVLRSHGIGRDVLDAVVLRLAGRDGSARFGVEAVEGFFWEDGFADEEPLVPGPVARSARVREALPADATVLKLMVRSGLLPPDELTAAVRAEVGDLVGVTHSAPGMSLVEMSAHGVHKAATLAEFAAERGIGREDVVAFGDMPNDLEMVQWAGTGLAVGSGHPDLLAAAAGVVGACDDDGVAIAIEQLLELPEH